MTRAIVEIRAGDRMWRAIAPDGRITIGKADGCEIRLAGWRIGREHAHVVFREGGWHVEDLGASAGTTLNGRRVRGIAPIGASDEIRIADHVLAVHVELNALDVTPIAARSGDRDATIAAERASHDVDESRMHENLPVRASFDSSAALARQAWRRVVHDRLLATIDLRRRDLGRMTDDELRRETSTLIAEIVDSLTDLPSDVDRAQLRREVLDEAIGLGLLESLLDDPGVSEIMVNRHDEVFVEREGRLERYPLAFTSDRAVNGIIERIVAPLGRRIDESSPMVDARLKDGSRVNAVIPPLALKGPALTIRKFARARLGVDEMLAAGSLSAAIASFLRICVEHRRNVVVSGGTGSGKTTLLNVLSAFIPAGERIVTIEDAAELKLAHDHLVALEARPSNVEGRGAISIRDLLRNALRMRPDRIVVGECRGGEALDMLQAMNTGHEGSLTTLHANTPRDALARLETLVLMAGMELPLGAIREQIASAVDIVVQQTRYASGARRISSVCEVTGLENGRVLMQELFRFEPHDDRGGGGRFVACDAVPSFYSALIERGAPVDPSIFLRAGK